jgi:hypothetical protein
MMDTAMDDYAFDEHPIRTWASRIAQFIVCIVLLAVIAGAVYATCLPSLTYQREHPTAAGK